MIERFPKCKKIVTTKYGTGEVKRQNILTSKLVVEVEGKEIEVHIDDILDVVDKRGKQNHCQGKGSQQ